MNQLSRTLIHLVTVASVSAGCGMANYSKEDSLRAYKVSKKIGIDKFSTNRHFIDPAFRPYFRRFEREYGGRIKELGVTFGRVNAFAACKISWFGEKHIVVNRSKYNRIIEKTYGELLVEMMIFHEMGHCVLERLEHFNKRITVTFSRLDNNNYEHTFVREVAGSIMNQELDFYDAVLLDKNRELYYDELFNGVPMNADLEVFLN